MGMSIDENIAILKEHLNTLNVDKGVEFYKEIESIQSAIDTMRKYQKIEEIMHIEMNGKEALQEIERILRG